MNRGDVEDIRHRLHSLRGSAQEAAPEGADICQHTPDFDESIRADLL